MALLQEQAHDSIEVVGLLIVERASEHQQTRRVWEERIQDFSPGEYLAVSQHARAHVPAMDFSAMLACVRLGLCDSHVFAHYLPRLSELAPEFDAEERRRVAALIDDVWAMYFPLGEDRDLPYGMACLLYEMGDYPRALHYFERSLDIYGPHTGTYYNMAACHHLLNRPELALTLLQRLLKTDPGNAPALELLDLLSGPTLQSLSFTRFYRFWHIPYKPPPTTLQKIANRCSNDFSRMPALYSPCLELATLRRKAWNLLESPLVVTIQAQLRSESPFTRLALTPSRDHRPNTSVGSAAEPSSCSPFRPRSRARSPAPLRVAASARPGPGGRG